MDVAAIAITRRRPEHALTQVHREAEGPLLAVQVLLAHGALALHSTQAHPRVLPSARQVLLAEQAWAARQALLEATKAQQGEMLERAKRDIETEKVHAIADLRREAVDLAIAGASKVIEKNLDDAQNRKLVENYLSSLETR